MAQRKAAISREILHQEGLYPEESSGLFVGISTFEDERFAPVRFAVDDAVDLAWVFSLELGLLDAGRCVLALAGEPQKEISQRRLEELLAAGARREVPRLTKVYQLVTELSQTGGERGIFLLTGATHGLSEQGGDFLVAADTRRDRLLKTGIEVKDIFDSAGTAIARRRLLLLDACRERLSQGSKSIVDVAMSQSFAGAIAKATGLTVLSGSTAGGLAYDNTKKQNGVFSGAVVDGLQGAARVDGRGFITISTLADYVQEQVQTWVRQHRTEHLKKSRGIERRFDEAAATLPLAIDPLRSRAIEEYQRRRALALVRLHENIGEILDGYSFENIKAFLPGGGPASPEVEELLAEIEALDGSKPSQRSLLHLFSELRRPKPVAPLLKQTHRWALGAVGLVLVVAVAVFGMQWLRSGLAPDQSETTVARSGESELEVKRPSSPESDSLQEAEKSQLPKDLPASSPPPVPRKEAAVEGPERKRTEATTPAKPGGIAGESEAAKWDASKSVSQPAEPIKNQAPPAAVGTKGPPQPGIEQASEPAKDKVAIYDRGIRDDALRPSEATQAAASERIPGELGLDHFGIHYRWIPGGTYTIGSPKEDPERHALSEQEPNDVAIKGFWLAETEVTQAFWTQEGLEDPSIFSSCAKCPVENVSWYAALALANRLSQQAGLESCYELICRGELGTPGFECSKAEVKKSPCEGYRLPTEEEWEVAARAQAPGGAYQSRYGELAAVAWYGSNSGGKTHPVGEKAANAWGLRDMLGNVWEWTNSPMGSLTIFRGGSWKNNAGYVRAASRSRARPGSYDGLGFRFFLGRLRSGQGEERGQEVGAERRLSE